MLSLLKLPKTSVERFLSGAPVPRTKRRGDKIEKIKINFENIGWKEEEQIQLK